MTRQDSVGAHLEDMEEISWVLVLSRVCCKLVLMASRRLACSIAYLDAAMLCVGSLVPCPG